MEVRIERAHQKVIARNDLCLQYTLLRVFIGLMYSAFLELHDMHSCSTAVDGNPVTFGAWGRTLNGVVGVYGHKPTSQFIWGILVFLPIFDYVAVRMLQAGTFLKGLALTFNLLLFQFCLFMLDLLRHHWGYTTFFLCLTCMVRILQTRVIACEVAVFVAVTFSNMCTPKWSWSQDNPYFLALIFHLSTLFVGITILKMRNRILLRFWNQCHLFIIAQKRIEAKKKSLIDIATMHGIPEQSKYLHKIAKKDTADSDTHKVFQEMKRSSANPLFVELVKNLLDDNYLLDCKELPLSHRIVETSKIDPNYENLRINYSVIIAVKVLGYHESTSSRSLFRSANSLWDSSDACVGVPDESLFSVIDELAAKYGITFIRRFGNKWIGSIGFFDEVESGESRRSLCMKALQMCCDLQHLASIHQKALCCAIDAGSLIGGFVKSPCFDIFGTEIRWLLLQLSGMRKSGIYCTSAVTDSVQRQGKDKQGGGNRSKFHFDLQLPLSVRSSNLTMTFDHDGMAQSSFHDAQPNSFGNVQGPGLEEDTDTFLIMDPIECSSLNQSDVDTFGDMITNEKKSEHSIGCFLARGNKAAQTREMKGTNIVRGEESSSRGQNHHGTKAAPHWEIDPTFIEKSVHLTGISLVDSILADYSDEEWEEMHEQLQEKLKSISWEVVFRRSYFSYIFSYTGFTDPYHYNALADDQDQGRQSYFWPNFLENRVRKDSNEGKPIFFYDPLNESQLPVESHMRVMNFFARIWYRAATSKNVNLLRVLYNKVSFLAESLSIVLTKRGGAARAGRKERGKMQRIPTYEFLDSNYGDVSLVHKKEAAVLKASTPNHEDPELSARQEQDNDKEGKNNGGKGPVENNEKKKIEPMWGTSISFKKFYDDSKYPFLSSSGAHLFRFITSMGLIYFAVDENAGIRYVDDNKFGSSYTLAASWIGPVAVNYVFEVRFDYTLILPLSLLSVAFHSLKFPLVDHPRIGRETISEFWQSYTFATFGDVENEVAFLVVQMMSMNFCVRKPWQPLIQLIVYICAQATRYPSTFLARISSMQCSSVILWYFVALCVTFICEMAVLHTYLVEHVLTPFTLKVDEKYSNLVEYYMHHYCMNSLTAPINKYGMIQPAVYRDSIIMVMHIKSSDILAAVVDSKVYGQFISSIIDVVQECATETGISVVNIFSGYVVLAALKSSVDFDDQNADYTGNIAKPFFFIRSFERHISAFMAAEECSVDWSMGIGIGTISMGLVGCTRGTRGNMDVVGDVLDLACVCCSVEESGVCVYATRAFHDATVLYNILPSNFLTRKVTLQVGHVGIELFKFQKASYGMTIDDFEYEGFLNSGGFGSVHLAREKRTSTQYAIKVVEFPKRAPVELRRTILAEFKIINELQHTNVIFYKHCFMTSQRLYYVMVCMRGGNLKQVVEKYRPSLGDLLYWYAELVLALEYIHENKVIHHDVKPANCLIGLDGHLRLSDFGLSKVVMSDKDNGNMPRSIISPAHISDSKQSMEKDSTRLISKVLALRSVSNLPLCTVLVAANKQSKTKKELKALSYACLDVDSPEKASEKLRSGYTDMIILDIAEQETEGDLGVTVPRAATGDKEVLSKSPPSDLYKDEDPFNSGNNSVSSGDGSNFYLEILGVAAKVAPMLPVIVLNRSQVSNTVLQALYEKRFPDISTLHVIAAPLSNFRNVEFLESITTAGRQALNDVKSHASSKDHSSSHSADYEEKDTADLGLEGDMLNSTDFSGLPQPSTSGTANQRVQDATSSTTMQASRPIGTSSFIAPELIEGRPYGPSVDWWACGVTIYECTTGKKLFGGRAKANSEVFKNILELKLELSDLTRVCTEQASQVGYPKRHLMNHCYGMLSDTPHTISNIEDLVAGLLCRNQAKRLGSGGPHEIKSHRFYRSVNWSTHNTTEPEFKPAPLPVFDHPVSARKLVTVTRHGKRTKVRAEELFYGETHQPHKSNGQHKGSSSGSDNSSSSSSSSSSRNISSSKGSDTKSSSSKSSRRSKSLRQTSRKMSAERIKFSNIADLRQNWLRRWPTVNSNHHVSLRSEGDRRSRRASDHGLTPLIEEVDDSMPSFGKESASATSEYQTGNSTTDMSLSLSRTETGTDTKDERTND